LGKFILSTWNSSKTCGDEIRDFDVTDQSAFVEFIDIPSYDIYKKHLLMHLGSYICIRVHLEKDTL